VSLSPDDLDTHVTISGTSMLLVELLEQGQRLPNQDINCGAVFDRVHPVSAGNLSPKPEIPLAVRSAARRLLVPHNGWIRPAARSAAGSMGPWVGRTSTWRPRRVPARLFLGAALGVSSLLQSLNFAPVFAKRRQPQELRLDTEPAGQRD
jgi:hypothetical protein